MEERPKDGKPVGAKIRKKVPGLGGREPEAHNDEVEKLHEPDHTNHATEKMEVHHHPEVEKKGFKEYILEGLMIFVAVTMGFFAESIRENVTNGEHVKQLTTQLVHDLKNDTKALNQIDSAETLILRKTDTLSGILQQPMASIDMKKMQLLITACYSQWPFYPSLGGASAIKNELRLKQFSSSKINNYLTAYEARTAILHKIEDIHSKLISEHLEGFFRLHFTPANLALALDHKPVVDGQMRDLTQKDLTQLAADLVLIRNINNIMISYNRKLKTQAVELIDFVKKQYNPEDE